MLHMTIYIKEAFQEDETASSVDSVLFQIFLEPGIVRVQISVGNDICIDEGDNPIRVACCVSKFGNKDNISPQITF